VVIGTGSTCDIDPSNWSMISQTRDPKDPGEESLERDFLSRDSGSRWQFAGKSNPVMHFLVKTINKHRATDNFARLIIVARTILCNVYIDK
jgi:hypothetical protein